jgi:hypothetical protein
MRVILEERSALIPGAEKMDLAIQRDMLAKSCPPGSCGARSPNHSGEHRGQRFRMWQLKCSSSTSLRLIYTRGRLKEELSHHCPHPAQCGPRC